MKSLHRLAHQLHERERSGHTLQTTALVNEGLRQADRLEDVRWQTGRTSSRLGAVDAPRPVDFARARAIRSAAAVRSVELDEAAVWLTTKIPTCGA